ncbi:hypothetical protein AMATHDRAFT_136064 [Amanita thiersii Skay4041]|uniref:G-patch domain-containing protein n=1 Tax=Amanita thiersii Skay4041 TaxID=703135 RepID=A0A2A9P0K4_9AGAR|nr:hypothetical protein AMATHDRAFT_136064 [Amanita thiersii Skay4041]
MPLDGHAYLVAQGWAGKGSGLREGAISKPLAIPQKRNIAGLGKDRDEAFPFWDHLFTAAACSIQLKIHNSDSEDEADSGKDESAPVWSRTSTGILSNRRPVTGTSAQSSGASTPNPADQPPKYNLLVTAKREAAKRSLYSRFFRGPVISEQTDGCQIPSATGKEQQLGKEVVPVHEPKDHDGKKTKKRERKEDADGRDDKQENEGTRETKRGSRDKEQRDSTKEKMSERQTDPMVLNDIPGPLGDRLRQQQHVCREKHDTSRRDKSNNSKRSGKKKERMEVIKASESRDSDAPLDDRFTTSHDSQACRKRKKRRKS